MYTLSKSQIKLIKSLHQKKDRQEQQLFLIEGEKLINETLRDKPEIIQWIIVQKGYDFSINLPSTIEIFTVNEHVYHSLSMLSSPQPLMAVCKFLPIDNTIEIDLKSNFSFYLDDINDPGNLGTIIRICDWFGINQIFCSKHTVDLYNPKVIQASKGSFLRVKVNYLDFDALPISDDVPIYATDMQGTSVYSIKQKRGIIVLGNEANGISSFIKRKSHDTISIPKHPNSKAESLNVAMSAAIIASEFFK